MKAIIVQRMADQDIPDDFLKALVERGHKCMGLATIPPGEKMILLQVPDSIDAAGIKATLKVHRQAIMYVFCEYEPGENNQFVQPFPILVKDNGEVLVACALEGDFSGFDEPGNVKPGGWFVANEYLAEKVGLIYKNVGGDLDKLVEALQSKNAKREIDSTITTKGSITFLFANGKFLTNHRGKPKMAEFPWGIASDALDIGKPAAQPAAELSTSDKILALMGTGKPKEGGTKKEFKPEAPPTDTAIRDPNDLASKAGQEIKGPPITYPPEHFTEDKAIKKWYGDVRKVGIPNELMPDGKKRQWQARIGIVTDKSMKTWRKDIEFWGLNPDEVLAKLIKGEKIHYPLQPVDAKVVKLEPNASEKKSATDAIAEAMGKTSKATVRESAGEITDMKAKIVEDFLATVKDKKAPVLPLDPNKYGATETKLPSFTDKYKLQGISQVMGWGRKDLQRLDDMGDAWLLIEQLCLELLKAWANQKPSVVSAPPLSSQDELAQALGIKQRAAM